MANMFINAMTDLWNSAGTNYTSIKMNVTNAASSATSKLLDLQVGGTSKFYVDKNGAVVAASTVSTTGALLPAVDDGSALGSTTFRWSDLYGASTFTLNIGAGNWVGTHSPGIFTVSTGDLRVTTAGTHAESAVTVGGTQTLTNKTLTTPVIAAILTNAGATTLTLPTTPTTDTLVGKATTDTLTNKSLTSPTITGTPTATGATWASLGTATTIDINGGTVDGTTIGATTPAAITGTNLAANNATIANGLDVGGIALFESSLSVVGGINSTSIGSSTPSTGAFTTLSASSTVLLSPASANVNMSPTGTGTVTISPATAGTINNVAIGGSTPRAGAFTTLDASSGVSGTTGTFSAAVSMTALTATSGSFSSNLSTSGQLTATGHIVTAAGFITTGATWIAYTNSGAYAPIQATATNVSIYNTLSVADSITASSLTTIGGIVAGPNVYFGGLGAGTFQAYRSGTTRFFQLGTGIAMYTTEGSTSTQWTHGTAIVQARTGDEAFIINGPGYKPGGGSWTATSDARIKDVLGDYTSGLDAIKALRPVRYVYKGNDTEAPPQHTQQGAEPTPENRKPIAVPYPNSAHKEVALKVAEFIGLVAQEAEVPMPELVKLGTGFIDGVEVDDLRTLDTSPIIFALVNAVKELAARVEALEGKV